MGTERIMVRIKGLQVSLPIYDTPENTLRIVATIEDALETIEAEGGPISTMNYALRAACDFRHQLEAVQADRDTEVRDLLKRLGDLQKKLDQMEAKLDPSG